MLSRLFGWDSGSKRRAELLAFSSQKRYDLITKIKELDFVGARRALANDRTKARLADSEGSFPIHLCLLNRGSEGLITDLIDAFPGALLQRDPSGRLPFHIICRDNTCLLVYVQFVLQASPDVLKERDPKGDLPLHMTIRYRCPADTTLFVLNMFPAAAQISSADGDDTALHLALRFGCEERLVYALLEAHPAATRVRNKKQDLPIHRAALFNAELPVLRALEKSFPGSLAQADIHGNLPIHLYFMHMRGGRPTAQVLEFFLENNPAALGVRNKKRCTPLEILDNYYDQLEQYAY